MAYASSDILDQEEDNPSAGPTLPSSSASNNSVAPTSVASGSTQKTPGRFADLGEYLRVNGPQNFGQQVAGRIGQDIQKGQQTLSGVEDAYKQQVDANTIRDTNNLTGQLDTNPQGINEADFDKLRDAQYKGPSSLADTADLYNQTQAVPGAAIGKANASKTEGGRFALLDNYFGRPSYSQGQKALDNVLIQNDKNSQQAFDQMRANASQLQQTASGLFPALGNYSAQGRATTEGTKNTARSALGIDNAGNLSGGGAIGSSLSNLDSLANTQKAKATEIEKYLQQFGGATSIKQLSPEAQQALGITPDQYSGFSVDNPNYSQFNVDPGYFLGNFGQAQHVSPSEINRASVADADQQSRLRALGKLAGLDENSLFGAENVGAYANAPLLQAGQSPEKRAAFEGDMNTALQSLQRQEGLGKEVTKADKVAAANEVRKKYGIDPIPVVSSSTVPLNGINTKMDFSQNTMKDYIDSARDLSGLQPATLDRLSKGSGTLADGIQLFSSLYNAGRDTFRTKQRLDELRRIEAGL